ncbi:PREDICTED: alpha-N-acetylgalactosaminide alpha-2,6-sialyltransferase 1-like [Branchiostoma belcheri]|uniref:alpha-N-acetylgalactosaminide alpha-2,6-sialyltransferase n=1 Tax=Branchiostoma belcheri TaxID=7741 RepID=A0A6P4ZTI0_BRABE|nr:PREDICTED: alpha-N-acetylgalactosaminide alpha-2,6-sialyltransferase 1-like [Branchiostoma belcheri]
MTEWRPSTSLEFWGDLSDGKALDMLIPPRVRPELAEVPFATDPRHRISKCPTSLRQRADTSAWFGSRFVEDVKLFLDQDDINPAYWTEHLTYYKLPFGYRQENKTAVDLMVGALKNPKIFGPSGTREHPSVTDDSRVRCIRCAVVGSGGVMKGSKRGTEIDGHDYVFRVNHANMQEKFADDVGRKISFYTFYPESHEHDPRLAVSVSIPTHVKVDVLSKKI